MKEFIINTIGSLAGVGTYKVFAHFYLELHSFCGSVVGTAVGYVIDNVNFDNLGENYKNDLMGEIENGNFPAD